MSEYQYYEFQAVDHRLDEKQMGELRSYSSRADITPTSFVNEYSFGSFKGDANAWMEKYFDAYLYLANWGTRELQLRVPSSLLPVETAQLYCQNERGSVREKSGNLIFTFTSEDSEDWEWIEGGGILSSLLPVRDGLVRGDLRALYVGWLLSVQEGELADDSFEPPIPENLGDLTAPLSKFVDFLRVDPNLLAVAAKASSSRQSKSQDRGTIAAWVASLPAAEKDELLVRMMEGKDAHIGAELCSRFNRRQTGLPVVEPRRRTVGELLAEAEAHSENRRIEENRKAAAEKAKQERLAAIAREKHLDAITERVPVLWREIDDLIASRLPKSYDLAVQHLLDLRDLAKRRGNETAFAQQIARLRETHCSKRSFLARLDDQGI